MINPMGAQANLFLLSLLVGAFIGILFDIFRIARKSAPHTGFLIQLEDIVFWIVATGGTFYFMLTRSNGEVRIFSLLGVVLGAIFYFATISFWVVKIFVVIINFVKKVVLTALKIIFSPIRLIYLFLSPYVKSFVVKRRKDLHLVSSYGKIKARKLARNWFIFRKKV